MAEGGDDLNEIEEHSDENTLSRNTHIDREIQEM